MPHAGRRMAPSASTPAMPLSGRSAVSQVSQVRSPQRGPTLESIEKQKMRLASKMEVFQAAQQQLNNVGNLSADELRSLLQRLHADPLADNQGTANSGGD